MKKLIFIVLIVGIAGGVWHYFNSGLVVKGLYLGMPFDDAQTIANKLLTEVAPKLSRHPQIQSKFEGNTVIFSVGGGFFDSIQLTSTPNNKLKKLQIKGDFADVIFNVQDLDASKFSELFQKSYSCSDFKFCNSEYVSLNKSARLVISISQEKTVTVAQIGDEDVKRIESLISGNDSGNRSFD